jgi:hypothetical protein
MTCEAIQYSDEMACARCRLRWDTNDPEPPSCLKALLPVYDAPPMAPLLLVTGNISDAGLAAAVARLLSVRRR